MNGPAGEHKLRTMTTYQTKNIPSLGGENKWLNAEQTTKAISASVLTEDGKDAGLEHLRFHDLRHTFATMALQNGVDVKTVSSMLGHYEAGFTLSVYAHATDRMQEEAAERMGSFMAQAM